MPSNHQIVFPESLAFAVQSLPARGFMTPTLFSGLAMQLALPAQYLKFYTSPPSDRDFYPYYVKNSSNHGLQRIELEAKIKSEHYVIYFPGNGEDATDAWLIDIFLNNPKYKNSNYLFWNYPGVAESSGHSTSVHDLIAAGQQQVSYLLSKGVKIENITLYGRSLGGGVAAQVASGWAQEKQRPKLVVERSFSALSSVVSETFRRLLAENPRMRPFYSAILACAILGLSLGVVIAGYISTIGILCATVIAGVGVGLALCVTLIRIGLDFLFGADSIPELLAFLDNLAIILNDGFSRLAEAVYRYLFNWVGSVVGAVVAIPALLVGALLGAGLGAILSLQRLVTDDPSLFFPLTYAFKWLAFVLHVELNSVAAIESIVANETGFCSITSHNVYDDEVIIRGAALNDGLRLKRVKGVEMFWHKDGGHNKPMGRILSQSFNGEEIFGLSVWDL